MVRANQEIYKMLKNGIKVTLQNENGEEEEYSIPISKFLRVQDRDWIAKGEKIDDGPIDPHDILMINGPRELQKFLVNERVLLVFPLPLKK